MLKFSLHPLHSLDRRLEDFLEVDVLSMSMSMGTETEQKLATLEPVTSPSTSPADQTDSPSEVIVVEAQSSIPCTGATSTAVVFTVEVELTPGKTDFATDLERALTNSLSNKGYTMCDPRRGLKRHRKRKLQDGALLSPVIVIETGQSCGATSSAAGSCRTASVAMEAYGTEARDEVVAAVDTITNDDATFESELMTKGIVDVRVIETSRGNNVAESNSSASSANTVRSSQTVMAVVLSVAAVTLVVAIILRQGTKRRRQFGYGPTMEEAYDESHCLGIQSLERMEQSSDYDTHYTPDSAYPQAASF